MIKHTPHDSPPPSHPSLARPLPPRPWQQSCRFARRRSSLGSAPSLSPRLLRVLDLAEQRHPLPCRSDLEQIWNAVTLRIIWLTRLLWVSSSLVTLVGSPSFSHLMEWAFSASCWCPCWRSSGSIQAYPMALVAASSGPGSSADCAWLLGRLASACCLDSEPSCSVAFSCGWVRPC